MFSSSTVFFQDFLNHFHSRRLLLHIPLHQSPVAAPPLANGNHHDPLVHYAGETTFDANVIGVLSLLMCGLICSIILNFIVKCALRCASSATSESNNPSTPIASTGIEKKSLKTFNILKYSAGLKLPGLGTECVICLAEFKPGECLRVLPMCNHGFHVRCINKWLNLHSSCPTCRNCQIETSQKIVGSSPASSSTPSFPATQERILIITPLEPQGSECNLQGERES